MRVLVTGGTRGIGREIVEAIVARGKEHVVYLGCRDIGGGRELAEMIKGGVVALELDVTDRESIAAAAAQVASSGLQLDAVVCNAGVMLERDGCDLAATIEPTFRVNVDGVVAVTEAFISQIADGGQIINVSSGARPVHLIITMIKWVRTSRLSIKNSLSRQAPGRERRARWTSLLAPSFRPPTHPRCAPSPLDSPTRRRRWRTRQGTRRYTG